MIPVFKVFFIVWISLVCMPALSDNFQDDLVAAALKRTQQQVRYDATYYAIDYPGGDVPQGIGVCTDLIIRSYRALGTDLQQLVHEDMASHFSAYPSQRIWGLQHPDPNIDHRRVPNLQTFFTRKGISLPITSHHEDFQPGDLVTWMLPGNLPHIGIVSARRSMSSRLPMIIHNIGAGPVLQDMLYKYVITGHYRYVPQQYSEATQ
jgi:uncharacterized protein YijF (DUF1287 family)